MISISLKLLYYLFTRPDELSYLDIRKSRNISSKLIVADKQVEWYSLPVLPIDTARSSLDVPTNLSKIHKAASREREREVSVSNK